MNHLLDRYCLFTISSDNQPTSSAVYSALRAPQVVNFFVLRQLLCLGTRDSFSAAWCHSNIAATILRTHVRVYTLQERKRILLREPGWLAPFVWCAFTSAHCLRDLLTTDHHSSQKRKSVVLSYEEGRI